MMTKIFIPYVYHNNIDEKYYKVRTSSPLGNTNNEVEASSVFNTGVKLSKNTDFSKAYLFLIEMLMLYDTCYISQDDLVYLYAVIGKDNTELLLKSNAIKIYNSQFLKLALHKFDGRFNIFTDYRDLNIANLKRKIYSLLSSYPKENLFKEWYIKSVLRNYEESFFINDMISILDDSAKKSLEDLFNSEIIDIIDNSKSEVTSMVDYKQMKLNRLLHLHHYINLSKHIGCDFLYVPDELNGLFDYFDTKDVFKNTLEFIFNNIKVLEQIPDIAHLVEDDILSIEDIVEIRSTKEAKKFREWMHAINVKASKFTDDEVKSFYHKACMNNSKFSKFYNSKKGNIIRTSLSMVTSNIPGVSLAVGLTDLLISLGLDNYNPSQFTNDEILEKIKSKTKNHT